MSRSNSIWLDIRTGINELFLQEYHQAYASEVWSRNDQKPQLLMFIGSNSKAISMQKLFTLSSNTAHGEIHLRKVPKDKAPDSPLFVADCGLHNAGSLERVLAGPVPADIDQRPITWSQIVPPHHPTPMSTLVYGQLISSFSTVVCVFADDVGGPIKAAEFLSLWLLTGQRPLDLSPSAYPRLLVLKEWDDSEKGNFDESLAANVFRKSLHRDIERHKDGKVLRQFSALAVLPLPSRNQRSSKRHINSWETLLHRILHESKKVQDLRKQAQMEFSAKHFKALFHSACDHFAANFRAPFSFVAAARLQNPVPSGFATHLTNFLQYASDIKSFAVPIIASALTLDSYPPGMHRFDPATVFNHLYFTVFREIQRNLSPNNPESFSEIYHLIKKGYCQQVLKTVPGNSAAAHKDVLARFSNHWKRFRSFKTCLACTSRGAEQSLSCKHALCETCIIRDGHSAVDDPWEFEFDRCPLCDTQNTIKFRMKPYTAGVRGLSIDDSLREESVTKILIDLEYCVPWKYVSLQKYFDIVVGSGAAGAKYFLGVFCKGWSVKQCIENLKKLEPNGSRPTRRLTIPWRRSSPRSTFKDLFGPETLFECHCDGTKVIIAAAKKDGSTCIFSNYNGPTRRSDHYARHLIRPKDIKKEALICDLAEGSGPLSHLRPFLDADKPENWLISLEQDFIWSRANNAPDVLLMFRGTFRSSISPRTGVRDPPNIVHWSFGQPGADANSVSKRRDFWREELLASLFYLELDGLPVLVGSRLICQLRVRCRWAPSLELQGLMWQLHEQEAEFKCGSESIRCIDPQLYDRDKNKAVAFSRRIEVTALSRNELINVTLNMAVKGAESKSENRISNCPYKLTTLIHDQGLDCFFGHKDHKERNN